MTISWPPYGRWAAGYGKDEEALNWVPKSTDRRQGRLCPAAGRPSRARRRLRLSVASTSKNKDAAYLFIQWLNSEEMSLERVKLPNALRDPFRDIALHRSGLPRAVAGSAKAYLPRSRTAR